jgi:putative SOS response-associated peptidase YedK
MTTNQEAVRRMSKVAVDNTGNLPLLPGIYPTYSAPIVRNSAAGRVGEKSDLGVTNARNATSSHWRGGWAPDNGTFGGRTPVWFAFDESRPLACFAGIWTRWTSVRKVREGETTNDVFAFLTINPNAEVAAIDEKAMPMIPRTPVEIDTWMAAEAEA